MHFRFLIILCMLGKCHVSPLPQVSTARASSYKDQHLYDLTGLTNIFLMVLDAVALQSIQSIPLQSIQNIVRGAGMCRLGESRPTNIFKFAEKLVKRQ